MANIVLSIGTGLGIFVLHVSQAQAYSKLQVSIEQST